MNEKHVLAPSSMENLRSQSGSSHSFPFTLRESALSWGANVEKIADFGFGSEYSPTQSLKMDLRALWQVIIYAVVISDSWRFHFYESLDNGSEMVLYPLVSNVEA